MLVRDITADNNYLPSSLTADDIARSVDHEKSVELSHDTANNKSTLTFVREAPSNGTIIKVTRRNDK